MKVEKWISYEEAEKKVKSFGGLGGFFANGMRWNDYIEAVIDEIAKPYAEALREEIVKIGLKDGGDWHQNADEGVPLFDDDTVAIFSYRAWGDLLAAIWSEKEDKDYSYTNFYMSSLI